MTIRVGSPLSQFANKVGKVSPGNSSWERVFRTGIIKVGYANERPFSYRDKTYGPITGESWEIGRVILEKMGVRQIEGIQTEFWSLIPKLLNRTYDMIAAGFYITPARFKEITFSYPTYKNKESVVVKTGNPLGIRTFTDLIRHPFGRVAVVFGSVTASHIRMYNLPPSRIVQFADGASAVKGIRNGEADMFASSGISLNDLVTRAGSAQLEIVQGFNGFVVNGQPMVDFGAFGFRKDDLELRNQFNTHLKPFIGSEDHLSLVGPFGFTREELPGELPLSIIKMLE